MRNCFFHDSIITVGNGGTKPAKAVFTIVYNHGTSAYEDELLQPDQQMWIDVGQLTEDCLRQKIRQCDLRLWALLRPQSGGVFIQPARHTARRR